MAEMDCERITALFQSWILGTLQDLVQGCDILFVCVVPSPQRC
jgi:hypothetical protein